MLKEAEIPSTSGRPGYELICEIKEKREWNKTYKLV
jgi:hypothetical protein